ncbi:MAG: ferredoxin-type protein NapF [Candidatus Accumulibacter sp.]|uniref:ferredoxin-type protein NapF n=1 Tax=Accumulibacter sp. TaxID=2053492 RepID=UPI0028795672|nr:ferredoxin-type protein NapF [Accumulibacter sp.]MDS4013532.1 ferredoxin-type protein NapF [Accumulibacter sp.]
MVDVASRRNFLRGRFGIRPKPLRPPWALAEHAFQQACSRCGACCKVCPTGIVVSGDGGYPEIDFVRGECTFCAACVSVCPSAALQRGEEGRAWSLRAALGEGCLATRAVECRVCADLCLNGAILFLPQRGGIARPIVDETRCTGCGACLAPCPTRAINVCRST